MSSSRRCDTVGTHITEAALLLTFNLPCQHCHEHGMNSAAMRVRTTLHLACNKHMLPARACLLRQTPRGTDSVASLALLTYRCINRLFVEFCQLQRFGKHEHAVHLQAPLSVTDDEDHHGMDMTLYCPVVKKQRGGGVMWGTETMTSVSTFSNMHPSHCHYNRCFGTMIKLADTVSALLQGNVSTYMNGSPYHHAFGCS